MKIKYVKGDVTEAKESIIAHGCNAQGVMGSGVAAIIRKKYPDAFVDYMQRHNEYGLHLGTTNCFFDMDSSKTIANCITQEFYGTDKRHADYEGIANVMHRLNSYSTSYLCDAVAMPLIGAGLAGGDWNVISAIIESEFKDVTPVVYVFDSAHFHLLDENDG